ncbi:lytic transglycosylase domain-containing protein [Sphingomonas cannabina]|nr:lytic transglycosylase domain-containing protein [Sphingomonas cannabina]UIJ43824.1 lytic transglycosylase domain-containing protein [Sphingomonas cannabina]
MSSMLGWVSKGALLLACVSGGAIAAGLHQRAVPQQLLPPQYNANTSGGAPQQILPSQVYGSPAPTPTPTVTPSYPTQSYASTGDSSSAALLSAIDQWKMLQQSDNLGFSTYANFLLAHPGWPGETSRRAAAETSAGQDSPSTTVRFFDRFPPLTGSGHVRYAVALAAMGQRDRAAEQARKAWRKGVLRPSDESLLLGQFSSSFGPDDQDARMDMLLWQGATSAAQRQLAYTSPARQAIFAARLAYRTNAPDAMTRGAAVEASALNDAGFLADRASWYRNNNASPTARAQLARPHQLRVLPTHPEKWYEVLLTNARGAYADRQYQTAYDIARQVDDAYPPQTDVSSKSLGERDDYTSLVWLAGTAAMQNLGRPRDAIGMFERYSLGSKSPTTQSKGLYWAGRAAEAAGDPRANDFYTRAAGYSDLYYGQLAAERLGQALRAPAPIATVDVAPDTRSAFAAKETVRAARLLGSLGRWEDQSAFVRQIAADATTDTDHLLAAELSRAINRPDLGVMVGRSALQNGLSDYTAAGYPSVRVPAASNDYWTIVHAIARQESQFNRTAISHAGARGLLQLMPGTAREQAGKLGLSYNPSSLTTDTDYNIMLGSSYFDRMYRLYNSYPLAVAAYNAGPGNVNKWIAANGDPRMSGVDIVNWIENIPIYETKNYVQRVLENAVVYDLMNPQHARSRGPNNLSWYLGKRRPG